ncbi:hypothetical protein [Saccharibacillus kuerlensis]|uniref:DUF1292 domain-containing protein n=1 Tax=Saccharibacillus kuerlensis TaxID=459527 RepID=A0ABQ2L182_9BACL|nr:hypothetical protein [Saccharibacillus kuerlensis]GGN98964.1 hypothetical protein GCM10010969_18690 [Saccharibacillus kuerlensis]
MNIKILNARMERREDKSYMGKVEVEADGHREPYELTIYSKNGNAWEYSLHFLKDPGPEEEILALEEYIESDDDAFDNLVDAAWDTMEQEEQEPGEEQEV